MKTVDRKIRCKRWGKQGIEILDRDSKKHLLYVTIIGVLLYLNALSLFGVH